MFGRQLAKVVLCGLYGAQGGIVRSPMVRAATAVVVLAVVGFAELLAHEVSDEAIGGVEA